MLDRNQTSLTVEISSKRKLVVTSLLKSVNALPLHLRLRVCLSMHFEIQDSWGPAGPSPCEVPAQATLSQVPTTGTFKASSLPAVLLSCAGCPRSPLGPSSNVTYTKTQSLTVPPDHVSTPPLFALTAPYSF